MRPVDPAVAPPLLGKKEPPASFRLLPLPSGAEAAGAPSPQIPRFTDFPAPVEQAFKGRIVNAQA
ncbi:MAG: hypothetical protein ACLGQW_08610 [Acidobacteriota bacterium]